MALLQGTPGLRFSARYRRRRRRRSSIEHHIAMTGALALMLLGPVLFFTPGPGLIIFGAGAALLARESPAAARFFDRTELRLRAWLRIRRPR